MQHALDKRARVAVAIEGGGEKTKDDNEEEKRNKKNKKTEKERGER
jgi:hypothetical protein